MATVEVIKVYADGTGDFTSLKTAIQANEKDLVAAGESIVFELKGHFTLTGAYIDLNPWTTDATHKIYIKASNGEETDGVPGSSTTSYTAGPTYLMVARTKNVEIGNLEILGGELIHSGDNVIVTRCLIHDTVGSFSASSGTLITNCILYNIGSSANTGTGINILNGDIHQCTIVSAVGYGGYGGQMIIRGGTGVITQTVVVNADLGGYDNYFQTTNVLNDYNADSENKAPGTTTFTASLADFVDPANNNYNLSPSSPLYTAGPNGESVGAVLAVETVASIPHDLIITGTRQYTESGVLSLSQEQYFKQTSIAQNVQCSIADLAKKMVLAPIKSAQAQASSFTEILQENLLSVASSAQHIELSTVDLLIDNALTIASSAQATESSLVSLLSGTQLITLSTQQVVASLVSAIAQQQLLAPVNTAQAICSSTANINADAIFVLHNSEQKIVSTTADINHVKQWITTSTEQQVNSSVLSAFEIKQLTTISSAQRVQLQRIIQATGLMPDIDLDKITIISLTPTYIVKSRTPRYIIQ